MDPYLVAIWPDFHRQLVTVLHQMLSGLSDRYRSRMDRRSYQEHGEQYVEVREAVGRLVTLVDVVSPANKTTSNGREAYLQQRRAAKDNGANIVEIDERMSLTSRKKRHSGETG
jgi:hypothetical protein